MSRSIAVFDEEALDVSNTGVVAPGEFFQGGVGVGGLARDGPGHRVFGQRDGKAGPGQPAQDGVEGIAEGTHLFGGGRRRPSTVMMTWVSAGTTPSRCTRCGGEVIVPGAPERVVVLNHALTGYLYHLDVPVAGVIPETADTEGAFSEHWAEAVEEDGTEILPWSSDEFGLEAVLATEPDPIVAGGLGFPHFQAVEAYDRLSEIAPTVIVDVIAQYSPTDTALPVGAVTVCLGGGYLVWLLFRESGRS